MVEQAAPGLEFHNEIDVARLVRFAMLLQYVIPSVCLLGAGLSAYQRYLGRRLYHRVAASPAAP